MSSRFQTLDGWRGLSILLVLTAHLIPLGPNTWQLSSAVGATGMALFFILSGFLITNILLTDQNIPRFLIRRFCRILPLAWLFMLITLILRSAKPEVWLPHLLFYANWSPSDLIAGTGHLWSLCVEMQFYVLIAVLVAILNKRALLLLPVLCLAITAYKYCYAVELTINTYDRIDEIFAGCTLALIHHYSEPAKQLISRLNPIYLLPLLLLSAHPIAGALDQFRPYIAMLTIGSALYQEEPDWRIRWLDNKALLYAASTSYALYVVHAGLFHTWLGEGSVFENPAKRLLLIATTFLLAHISTFYYEKHWIELGKRLTSNERAI